MINNEIDQYLGHHHDQAGWNAVTCNVANNQPTCVIGINDVVVVPANRIGWYSNEGS
jgi:hypothetical protein